MASEPKSVVVRLRAQIAAGRFDFDSAQQEAAALLDKLSDGLRRQLPTLAQRLRLRRRTALRGLYLWGGVGRGKTVLMDWFYEALQSPDARRRTRRIAERSHFYHFMRQVHADLRTVGRRAQPLEAVAHRLVARAQVICLDEFFVADIADAMILAGLFDALFRRGVTLVATSNLAPQELYKDGLQRQRFLPAIDLIQSRVHIVHLDGGVDYRLRRLAQAPTYLNSTLGASAAEFSA